MPKAAARSVAGSIALIVTPPRAWRWRCTGWRRGTCPMRRVSAAGCWSTESTSAQATGFTSDGTVMR